MTSTTDLQITEGCTLEILKGLRDAWMHSEQTKSFSGTIKIGEKWKVVHIGRPDTGLLITLLRLSNNDRVRLCTSAAGKTAHPEFNLHTGDPTRNIRVKIVARPTIVEHVTA